MTASVDFGSHRIRVARMQNDRIVASSFRSVYSVLPDSQEQRAMLARLSLPYAVCDSHLAVIGDFATELRCVSNMPPVPFFAPGQTGIDDPPARQILNVLVESMLPQNITNEYCAVTVPACLKAGNGGPEFLHKLVSLRGYTPLPVSSGLATVLAEGCDDRFSAIGISFGANCCHVGLVARGNQIDEEVVDRGGAWMDIELARHGDQYVYDRDGQCYLDTEAISNWKEAKYRSLGKRESVIEHTLANLYADILSRVVSAVDAIVSRNKLNAGPLPILCCGGVASINDFEAALRNAFRSSSLNANQIGNIRVYDDQLTVARGGLIQVALQNETQSAAA